MKSHFYKDLDQRRAVTEHGDRLALKQAPARLRAFLRKKGNAPERRHDVDVVNRRPGDLDAVRLVISRSDGLDLGLTDRERVVD